MFHSFFSSLVRTKYLSIFVLFLFSLYISLEQKNPLYGKFFFFFLVINTMFGILSGIKQSICISKSKRMLCISFSGNGSGWCILAFVSMVKFYSFAKFPVYYFSYLVFSYLVVPSLEILFFFLFFFFFFLTVCCIRLLCDSSFQMKKKKKKNWSQTFFMKKNQNILQ